MEERPAGPRHQPSPRRSVAAHCPSSTTPCLRATRKNSPGVRKNEIKVHVPYLYARSLSKALQPGKCVMSSDGAEGRSFGHTRFFFLWGIYIFLNLLLLCRKKKTFKNDHRQLPVTRHSAAPPRAGLLGLRSHRASSPHPPRASPRSPSPSSPSSLPARSLRTTVPSPTWRTPPGEPCLENLTWRTLPGEPRWRTPPGAPLLCPPEDDPFAPSPRNPPAMLLLWLRGPSLVLSLFSGLLRATHHPGVQLKCRF